jgi:hypothetical protein
MTTISQAVHAAVRTAIVAALPSVPVYDHVTNDAAFPFIDLGAMNRAPRDTMSEGGFSYRLFPAVWSQYHGKLEVEGFLDAIHTALHNVHLNLATGHAVSCQVTEISCHQDQDGLTYQGGATIEIFAVI